MAPEGLDVPGWSPTVLLYVARKVDRTSSNLDSRSVGAENLVLGTSRGLLPVRKKLSEWLEDEELENLASIVP